MIVPANQPTTEDPTGRCGPLPNCHCSPAARWTTFNRSSGRTPHLPAGHPIHPLVTGHTACPSTKVSPGACGTHAIDSAEPPTAEVTMTDP